METDAISVEVVYLIGSRESGRAKIGRSVDIQGRLRDIQSMSPLALEILWTHPGGAALEAEFHRHFDDRRLHGEWFEFESAAAAAALVAEALPQVLRITLERPRLAEERAAARRAQQEAREAAMLAAAQKQQVRLAEAEERARENVAPGGENDVLLLMADLARILGVKAATIRHYRADSLPGGRYESNPFPEPDGKLANMPTWDVARRQEILDWAATRIGKGVGGGRPRREAIPE